MNEAVATKRRVLSVVGPHSGCGKTSFVTHLIRNIPGLGCLKISPATDWPDASLGPPTASEGFYLEDRAHLNRPGKDTAFYLSAGAVRVERLRHRADSLAPGLRSALQRFDPATAVVVESSSAVSLLKPAAVVLVVRPPPREIKLATQNILSKVTDLLINASNDGGFAEQEAANLCRQYPALHPQHTWTANLISEPPPIEMLDRLSILLTAK